MNKEFIYEKPFGILKVWFEKNNGSEIAPSANIMISINDEKKFKAHRFDATEGTIHLYNTIKLTINGKNADCAGFKIDNAKELIEIQNNLAAEYLQENRNRYINGESPIVVQFHDGEYLSAYTAYGIGAKLLEELGLASYISGWGTRVDNELIDTIGKLFTYTQALEYAKPALEEKERQQKEKEEKNKEVFNKAHETGERQLLYKYSDDCNDPTEDCSLDMVYIYAMPDGKIETVRQHTW